MQNKERFGLYMVLTDPVRGYEHCAREGVKAGLRYIQLRMKNASLEEVIAMGKKLKDITRNTESLLIINDSLEAAMAVDADGLHLGQRDMPLEEARARWGRKDKIFGLSTHNEAQAAAAVKLNPDYIGVGPVFPTPSKAVPDPVVGTERMGKIIKSSPLPCVAIGGINEDNLEEVLSAGAVNFCSLRPITTALHPGEPIARLMDLWLRRK